MTIGKEILEQRQGYLDLTDGEIRTLLAYGTLIDRLRPAPRYLEIGIWGGGTIHLLKAATRNLRFTGVDLFEEFQANPANTHVSDTFTMADVQAFLGERVQLVKGNSAVMVPGLSSSFDFIFIDGNHTYEATMTDFIAAQGRLRPGGYIAFHNCSAHLNPDFDYVMRDGGPWLVTEQLKLHRGWQMVAEIDRLRIFVQRGP